MIRIGPRKYSWHSTTVRIASQKTQKLTSIDWGQKITDELVYAMRADGTPEGVTAGKWEPELLNMKMLVDEWHGDSLLNLGFASLLSLGKAVGLADTEFDIMIQRVEPVVTSSGTGGVMTILFPVCRIVSTKEAEAEGVAASVIDIGVRVIKPPIANGVRLASMLRTFLEI
jgi:hypothetical protein